MFYKHNFLVVFVYMCVCDFFLIIYFYYFILNRDCAQSGSKDTKQGMFWAFVYISLCCYKSVHGTD